MWSLGCIIIELLTGDALFQTHENLEHLAMMEQVLGPLPANMALCAGKLPCCKYFVGSRLAWPDGATSKKSVKAVSKLRAVRRHLLENGDSSAVPHVDLLVDLVTRLLAYEPGDRLTAPQALAHPFMQLSLAPSIPPSLPSPHLLQGSSESQIGSLATTITGGPHLTAGSQLVLEGTGTGVSQVGGTRNNFLPFPNATPSTAPPATATTSTATTTYGW